MCGSTLIVVPACAKPPKPVRLCVVLVSRISANGSWLTLCSLPLPLSFTSSCGAETSRARLFVCNGGYGSIMLALANGVPVLSAGKREGKNDINARVDHFGVGIDLRTEQPTARQIARGVERVLGDARYATAAARVRDELGRYDPLDLITREVEA